MKNMKILKKSTAFLLTVVLLLSLTTVTAFATTGPMTKDNELEEEAIISLSDPKNYGVFYDGETVDNTALSGATYDLASNTLTLDNVRLPEAILSLWYVGDDFKLNIKGTCELACIHFGDYGYGSSLCITGDGTLTVVGQVGEVNEGIIAGGSGVHQVCVDKSVTLHYTGHAYAFYAQDISDEYADTIFMEDGKPMPGAKKGEYLIPCLVEKLGLILGQSEIDYDDYPCIVDYLLTRADDPDNVYAANLEEEDGTEYYAVSRYHYLESYDAYMMDGDFGEYCVDRVEKDKLEESGYSFVTKPAKTDVSFIEDKNIPSAGIRSYLLNNANDPDGTYVAVPLYSDTDSGSSDEERTVLGYGIHRLIRSEKDGLYEDDLSFELKYYYSVSTMQENGYSFVDTTEEKKRQLKVWHTNEFDSEDNWQSDLDLIKRSGSDDKYVVGSTYESSWDDPNSGEKVVERGMYLNKVHYDKAHNAYYINGEAEEDGEDVICISDEAFGASEFSYDTYMLQGHVTKFFFSQNNNQYGIDYGYIVSKEGDNKLYAAQELWYGYDTVGEPDEYAIYELKWNEDRKIYIGTFIEYYSAEDFKAADYSYVETEQPVAFEYKREIWGALMRLAEDESGNRYLCFMGDVYRYDENNTTTVFGKHYYNLSEADKVDIDPDSLSDVWGQESHGVYYYYPEGNGYHHIGTGGGQTEVLIGDVNGDGVVNGADSGLLARYTAGWKGYESKIKNMAAADINRDGNVNGADAGLLSRYTASWKGYDKYIKTVTV